MDKRFIQGTPEWLEMRRHLIMASDSPVIMGVSPWKTPHELYMEKVNGTSNVTNPAMERGKRLEDEARMIFEKIVGQFVSPVVKIHTNEEWLGASCDGWNDNGTLVEIKCPGREDHDLALDGKIPKKYYPQLQHLMYVFGVDRMYYFSYRPEDEDPWAILEVNISMQFIIEWKEKAERFYKCIKEKIPPYTEDRSVSKSFEGMEERLAYLLTEIKLMEAEAQKLRESLIESCEGKVKKGSLLKFTPITSKGNIDYSAIPQLKGVDLEFYRKPDKTSWRIEFRK